MCRDAQTSASPARLAVLRPEVRGRNRRFRLASAGLTYPFALVLAALLLAGCSPNDQKEDYYPMGVGSTWTYEVRDWGDTPSGTETLFSGEVTVQATKTDKLPTGEDVVLFVSTGTSGQGTLTDSMTIVDSSYVRRGGDCVLHYSDKADTTVADTVLKLPLAKGVTWLRFDTPLRVTEESDVTVKAGTFRAWKVEAVYDSSHQNCSASWWYADGIGQVKWHRVYTSVPGYVHVTHWELGGAAIR